MLRVLVLGVLFPALAFAQEPAPPEPAPPPIVPAEGVETPAETSAMPSEFFSKFLHVDVRGQVSVGREKRPISHRELFELAGRTDLVARSDQLASRRLWLAVGAGATAVAGGVTGAVLLLTSPKLASPACEASVQVYNEICVPRVALHQTGATIAFAGGFAIAALLATLSYWSNPDVTNRDETSAIASSYNAKLARELRKQSAARPAPVNVAPVLLPGFGGLVAQLRF